MVDQLSTMLQQLQTSLDDSVNALTKTGSALEKVDAQLETVQTDIKAMQSSEAYQEILELEGIDAEAISEFMASPVSINSEVLYDVKNYGTGMTPFYTNLALWVYFQLRRHELPRNPDFLSLNPHTASPLVFLLIIMPAAIFQFFRNLRKRSQAAL